MRAVLNITDAAYYLNTTTDALRDLVKHSKIPYRKRGEKLIFIISDLDLWLKTLPGLSLDTLMGSLTIPDNFRDTPNSRTPSDTLEHSNPVAPIQLTKGPKTRIMPTIRREQTR